MQGQFSIAAGLGWTRLIRLEQDRERFFDGESNHCGSFRHHYGCSHTPSQVQHSVTYFSSVFCSPGHIGTTMQTPPLHHTHERSIPL